MKPSSKSIVRALACAVLAGSAQVTALDLQIPVYEDSLDNGLRCIIVRDTNVAVVSCRLYYFVGSMYEGPGTSGLSHMFEHMMFKGTKRLGTTDYEKEVPYMAKIDSIDATVQHLRDQGIEETDRRIGLLRNEIFGLLKQQRAYIRKDEIWDTYQVNGGTHLNAWTSDDMTAYIVTLPRNKIELFYWIESDRMRDPVLREFYSERDVVTEERRMRYENRPVNRYWERLGALFYIAHPYRLPTIGWMSDIRSYTRSGLRRHVRRFYTPDNAVIVLNGNVDPKQAMTRIRAYFGTIPPASPPKREVVTREPPPVGETRFTVFDQAESRVDILFHIPGYPHEDLFPLDIVEGVLNGRSGRLYTRLVTDEGLCTDAGARNTFRLHNGYFHVYATLKQGADPDSVERILYEELDELASTPPTGREIERIKNQIRMSFVTNLTSLEGLSDRLAWFERLADWRDLFAYPDKIGAVMPDSVPPVAKRYFGRATATVGRLLQEGS
jgi:predicted Zn-dependent peptidase